MEFIITMLFCKHRFEPWFVVWFRAEEEGRETERMKQSERN